MTDRKNIKVQPETFKQHKERRLELGLGWDEYLKRCEFQGYDS